jgi:thymidylate kinase
MPTRFWFVIEGDNGAGKDSLADRLSGDGWFLATRIPEVVAEKEQAKRLRGKDRVSAFMAYNKTCRTLISGNPSPCFLERYWPSTVAAAFADEIIEWAEIENLVANILREFPAPKLILYLECDLDTRRNRIQERGPIPGSVDDLTEKRDLRYREAIRWLATHPGIGNWKTLDTSRLSIEQVYLTVHSMLPEIGELS